MRVVIYDALTDNTLVLRVEVEVYKTRFYDYTLTRYFMTPIILSLQYILFNL